MKRITALFTAIVMAIMTLSISVTADTFGSAPSSEIWDGSVDTSWYTGDKEVYDIGTASELAGLSELVNNGHCMQGIVINLTNDILLNDISNWRDWIKEPPKNKFTPIGHSGNPISGYSPFVGVFNGNGHTIRGLYVDNEYVAGLFGFLYCAGVTSVIIDKSVIIARDSKKENYACAGAIAGIADGSVITECENRGYVYSLGEQDTAYGWRTAYAGGIVGALKTENFSGIVAQVFVQAIMSMGGLFVNPMMFNDGHGGIIKDSGVVNCINRGYIEAISSTEVYLGEIVGWGNNGMVSNCISFGLYSARKGKANLTRLHYGRVCGGVFNCGVKNCYYLKTGTEVDVADKSMISPVTPVTIRTFYFTKEQLGSEKIIEGLGTAFVHNENGEPSLACDLRLPFDDSFDSNQVSQPVISSKDGTSSGMKTVAMTCPTKYAQIYYTVDGTEPTRNSKLYEKPFEIKSSTILKAAAYKYGMYKSSVVTVDLSKDAVENPPSNIENGWTKIIQDINNSSEKEYSIKLNGVTEVPADVINSIAKGNKKVELFIDDIFSWVIDGTRISVPANADLTFSTTTTQNPQNLRGSLSIQFKINDTGVPSDLTFNYVSGNEGKFANLYKNVNGKYVFSGNQKVANDGNVVLKNVNDKGEYVVMLSEFSDMPGDIDNDGFLSAKDALTILKGSVGKANGKNPLVADINNDGIINAKDALIVLKKSVGSN